MTHEHPTTAEDSPGRQVHILLQASPGGSLASEIVTVDGQPTRCLRGESLDPNDCLPVSFDTALEQLAQLPRMFIEPDGSWVWVSAAGPTDWQLDGQMHDGPNGLISVEIKGRAPQTQWETLLACFGWPEVPLLFQLVQQGLYLEEAAFREYLQFRAAR